jgi:hypothetical protein
LRESAQCLVRRGQRGRREIGERRQGTVVLAPLAVGGLDDTLHDDADFPVRLLDGQQVRDVAVGVDLLERRPGAWIVQASARWLGSRRGVKCRLCTLYLTGRS